ncbi:MAG: nucleoside 2-deoxyribosyltransferase [Candidatus Freyarchaeota archaeon]|nr:nucleoside 2-deoxyribosyltransferase [Candidatus Jordarchaeia archaeon]
MRVYLSAPLFCDAERTFNEVVAAALREAGFEVWLPQKLPLIKSGSDEEKRSIYLSNISVLRDCDVVVAVLDGVDVDSGVAFEIGYATALGKPVIGLKTDHRTFSKMEEVNLMLEVSIRTICRTISELVESLTKV